MQTFPGGIASSDGTVGVVQLAGQELVAVDLAKGSILWRQASTGRPVSATDRHLVVLEAAPAPAVSIRDLRSGTLMAIVDATALPAWIAELRDRPEALRFSARETDGVIEISWRARAIYTGGAAPRSLAPQGRGGAGSLRIDLKSGRKISAQSEDLNYDPFGEEPAPEGIAAARPLPGEVARSRAGERAYVLRIDPAEGGQQAVKLDAVKAGGDKNSMGGGLGHRATRQGARAVAQMTNWGAR